MFFYYFQVRNKNGTTEKTEVTFSHNLVEYRVYQSKMDETKGLRDRRINIFVELWCLVALGSLDI